MVEPTGRGTFPCGVQVRTPAASRTMPVDLTKTLEQVQRDGGGRYSAGNTGARRGAPRRAPSFASAARAWRQLRLAESTSPSSARARRVERGRLTPSSWVLRASSSRRRHARRRGRLARAAGGRLLQPQGLARTIERCLRWSATASAPTHSVAQRPRVWTVDIGEAHVGERRGEEVEEGLDGGGMALGHRLNILSVDGVAKTPQTADVQGPPRSKEEGQEHESRCRLARRGQSSSLGHVERDGSAGRRERRRRARSAACRRARPAVTVVAPPGSASE